MARADSVGAAPDTTDAPDATAQVLARAAVNAMEAAGGYAAGVYLRSPTAGLLLMAVFTGLPLQLFRPWWRMQVNRPYPVAEAYRSGQAVLLPDAESAMSRFPQLVAGLPFPFASLYEPVTAGTERFGVLVVLREATPGIPVGTADRERLRRAAEQLAADLTALAADGGGCCGRATRWGYRRHRPRPGPRVPAGPRTGSRRRCCPWTGRAGSVS